LSKKLPNEKLFPGSYKDPKTKKRKKPIYHADDDKIGAHHFFELLNWNPQAIILIALMWKSNSNLTLVKLYEMIVKQTMSEDSKGQLKAQDTIMQSL